MQDAPPVPPAGEPVEEFLDRLLLTLNGSPRHVRQTLAEVEAHLQDAVAEEIAAGRSPSAAEAAAVRRIGAVHDVAGRTARFTQPAAALLRRGVLACSLIGGVALVAVGVSGAIAWALARLRGGEFVTAPFPPGSYSSADCARWLAGDPGTHSCVTAMVADHVGDIVLHSFAGGLAGLVTLAAFWWLRLRWQDRATQMALPRGSAEAVGGMLALLVVIGALAAGVNTEVIERGHGAGQQFSLAIAALAAAVFFAIRLLRAGFSHDAG
jgi:hypothetical protein